MKHLRGKIAAVSILILLVCLILNQRVSAHACKAESMGGTVVKFFYSDGTPVKGARILIKDSSGETVGTGKTAADGTYDYADFTGKAAVIYMNDGEGHAVEYEIPAETPPADAHPAGSDAKNTDSDAQLTGESSPSVSVGTDAAAGPGTDWLKIAVPVLAVAGIAVLVLVLRRKRA